MAEEKEEINQLGLKSIIFGYILLCKFLFKTSMQAQVVSGYKI